jgi:uncharacterized protein YodC (DUF2158 family)
MHANRLPRGGGPATTLTEHRSGGLYCAWRRVQRWES